MGLASEPRKRLSKAQREALSWVLATVGPDAELWLEDYPAIGAGDGKRSGKTVSISRKTFDVLLRDGFIEKIDDNLYRLTAEGKRV